MRKALANFVEGWREVRWLYPFSYYLLLSILLTTLVSYVAGSSFGKPTDFDLLLALAAGCISFYLAKFRPKSVFGREQRALNYIYTKQIPILIGITLLTLFVLLIILGARLHITQKTGERLVEWTLILAGIVLTNILSLYSQFYKESQGYMLRAAHRIWGYLLTFFIIEWVVAAFFFYLTLGLLLLSAQRFVVAFIIGVLVAAIPMALERSLLPKKGATVKSLERRLTTLLLKLNIAFRHNFAWAIRLCQEQDLYECQQPHGWGLKIAPADLGRRIRKLYEFYKYRIAEERKDPSLLRYDVDRTPWEMFYLLVRHTGRNKLRQYLKNPVPTHFPDWDGSERRRVVGRRSDRKDTNDLNSERTRGYDKDPVSYERTSMTRTEKVPQTDVEQQDEVFAAQVGSVSQERFASWAFSTAQRLRKAVGIGVILAAAISLQSLNPQTWSTLKPDQLDNFFKGLAPQRANLALIQAAACFLLALLTPKPSISAFALRKGINRPDHRTAKEACKRIQLFVVAAYLAWSLYYLVTGLALVLNPGKFDQAISVTLNTVPSVLLFWLYLELAEFTVDAPKVASGERKQDKGEALDSAADDDAPITDAAFHRVISLGVFALTIVPVWYASIRNDENAPFIINIFVVISSCLNGVALALVVGRLGSKIIDPGSITLGLLYFYAVIQPTAATFHISPAAQLIATTVALPLKVLLWLVFVWAFTTGILSEYVSEIRVLLIRERTSRQAKLEKEHKF